MLFFETGLRAFTWYELYLIITRGIYYTGFDDI